MNREVFEQQYEPVWRRLEIALGLLETRRDRASAEVDELPELYRKACHHLALVRHRLYGADLEQRLNTLVLRGHQQLYRSRTGDFAAALRFVTSGFPRLVHSEVRLVLETEAARLGAERRNEADLEETAVLLEELAGASGEHGERRLIDLDERTHRYVARCAHNPFLEATLEQYYVLALRIWFLALDRVALDEAIAEHHAILEAIRDGDADRAAEVMRAHVVSFERAIRAVL